MKSTLGSMCTIEFCDRKTQTLEMAKRPNRGINGRMASQKGRILPVLFL